MVRDRRGKAYLQCLYTTRRERTTEFQHHTTDMDVCVSWLCDTFSRSGMTQAPTFASEVDKTPRKGTELAEVSKRRKAKPPACDVQKVQCAAFLIRRSQSLSKPTGLSTHQSSSHYYPPIKIQIQISSPRNSPHNKHSNLLLHLLRPLIPLPITPHKLRPNPLNFLLTEIPHE